MKRTVLALVRWLIGAVALGAGAGMLPATEGKASAQVDVSVDVFTDTLSPYGTWVTVDDVGRVWRPNLDVVGDDFQPYASGGHWVYTDYGWSFESDWEWGWAPFHYGRWYNDRSQGWVWVAGRTWGPAWVDWRSGGGYVGWVPSAPAGVTVTYADSPRQWSFVPEARFTDHRIWDYRVPRERAQAAFSASNVVTSHRTWGGTRFNAGPPPERIAAVTGHPVAPVRFTPPRRGEVATVRVTTHGVEKHAPPAVTTHAAPTPARAAPTPVRAAPTEHPAPPPQHGPILQQPGRTQLPVPARPATTAQHPNPAPAQHPTPVETRPTPTRTPAHPAAPAPAAPGAAHSPSYSAPPPRPNGAAPAPARTPPPQPPQAPRQPQRTQPQPQQLPPQAQHASPQPQPPRQPQHAPPPQQQPPPQAQHTPPPQQQTPPPPQQPAAHPAPEPHRSAPPQERAPHERPQ